ncbi:ABC transporter ATP-binding protein [Lysinibacillus piscis]|uniref:ABC transporter ATP-binding protein n=1 Tax=Lysinibacillus piscis TaxID=2518931 RepID=A0ABQ5NPF4_9BACI|nr:ABC transporter transmembrane domain-containing protein [Lysinibacillus sp. KH24]GLC90208.1 ABC transporter ATP-binding protein [Lysinibacillus sp. KH24]
MTNLTISRQEQATVLKRLIGYIRPHKKALAIAISILLLSVVGEVLSPIIIKTFIDNHVMKMSFETSAMVTLAISFMFLEIVNVICRYFQHLHFNMIALRVVQQIRVDVYEKVQHLGMRYFDRVPAGATVSRVTNDTEAIKDLFINVFIAIVQAIFLITGVFIAMFLLNAKLAVFVLFILPAVVYVVYLYRKKSAVIYMAMREKLSELNAKLSENLSGMSIIQMFRQEKRMNTEFDDINEQHFAAMMNNTKLNSLLLRPIIDLIYFATIVILLSFFGITSFTTAVEVGVVYAFVSYINRFFEPINQMMEQLAFLQQAVVAGKRVFDVLDEEDMEPAQQEKPYEITAGKIEFKDVTFSYDGQTDVLKNISFTVNPGETVALVGHTGSGKSSIINLLMRFYEFERGDIRIDGHSIKSYPQQQLRHKVGLVLQDPFLFYGTIASNIRLFGRSTEQEIKEAAEFVRADFIQELPNQFEQHVTERGSTYSSGQRQLIAFARTMARQPKILVLDEATASIDTETEVAIQESLERMRKGRTTIAIAHRLSTIQDAEQILVLHHGEIVERGNHQELLAKKGLYHKMYLLQNSIVE